MPDGCGGVLSCGSCGEGQTCGGGGAANVCGSDDGCTPTTCEAAEKTCGVISDGCGATLECGTCGGGAVCAENVCVGGDGGTCVPTTCAAEGATCGEIPDGCGGTLTCGSCGDGQTCSADHVCVEPAPKAWLTLEESEGPHIQFNELTVTGGNLVVSAWGAQGLWKYDGSGKLLQQVPAADDERGYSELSSAFSDGSFLALGRFRSAETYFGGTLLDHVRPDGSRVRRLIATSTLDFIATVAAHPSGAWAYAEATTDNRWVTVTGAGFEWRKEYPAGVVIAPDGVAFDPEGNVIVAGSVNGAVMIDGVAVGTPGADRAFVAKYGPRGQSLWVREIPAQFHYAALDTSARGTVALVGTLWGTLNWGKDVATGGAVLLTLESNGAPRWLRQVSDETAHAEEGGKHYHLAVRPEGEVAVAWATGCGPLLVARYELTGEKRWLRETTVSGCERNVAVVGGVAFLDSQVIVSGTLIGTMDFGTGSKTGGGYDESDGFLWNLGE